MLPAWFKLSSRNITYQLENAVMTPELCNDLTKFSFDDLQDILKNSHIHDPLGYHSILTFAPPFLAVLRQLVCYYILSAYLQILWYSHHLKLVISAKPFKLTLTECFVMSWKSIILFQHSPCFWEVFFGPEIQRNLTHIFLYFLE